MPQQILMWAKSLLKPFSLQIRAGERVYRLEFQSHLLSLIARKNKNGRVYKDSRNLLNQQVRKELAEEEDLFIDDCPEGATTGKPKAKKAKKQFNTARLDTGITHDEE